MRKQRYLRFNGLDIEDIKLHFCPFVKNYFSPVADTSGCGQKDVNLL